MSRVFRIAIIVVLVVVAGGLLFLFFPPFQARLQPEPRPGGDPVEQSLSERGREIFRHDTFGSENYFTDTLKLPFTTLLNTPATMRERTLGVMTDEDGKIVGVEEVKGDDGITRWGVTCALCHSVVDEEGIRQDGIPNMRLNVGAILALSPEIDEDTRSTLLGWGPGRFDFTFMHEADDGVNNPTTIQPAFGTKEMKFFDWDGFFTNNEDRNYYVAEFAMHGNGEFDVPADWDVENEDAGDGVDLIGPKMPTLQAYLDILEAPTPPPGNMVDPEAVARGKMLFEGQAGCAECHTPPQFSNNKLVSPEITGTDPTRANSPLFQTGVYKVPSLLGVWATAPYFHDGSAQSLTDVISHYNSQFKLNLSEDELGDLRAFLGTLPPPKPPE